LCDNKKIVVLSESLFWEFRPRFDSRRISEIHSSSPILGQIPEKSEKSYFNLETETITDQSIFCNKFPLSSPLCPIEPFEKIGGIEPFEKNRWYRTF
jgi:hypothetical protein